LSLLIGYKSGHNCEKVVHIALDLLIPIESEGMQTDVFIERF
jgi:hypothetical protein